MDLRTRVSPLSLLSLLDSHDALPQTCSLYNTYNCKMFTMTCIAAGRHAGGREDRHAGAAGHQAGGGPPVPGDRTGGWKPRDDVASEKQNKNIAALHCKILCKYKVGFLEWQAPRPGILRLLSSNCEKFKIVQHETWKIFSSNMTQSLGRKLQFYPLSFCPSTFSLPANNCEFYISWTNVNVSSLLL